jgi:spore maturation protein A
MNYLWGIMMLVGVVYAALTGNLEAVTEQALSSAKEAVSLCITMAGVMAFWVGMMQIADSAGMIRQAAKSLDPVLSFLFPSLPKGHPARKPIATNLVANVLGLGWAATPAGLEAMKALAGEEDRSMPVERADGLGRKHKAVVQTKYVSRKAVMREETEKVTGSEGIATDAMCDFLILNISSLQLIPVNIIAYRSQYGSVNPSYIVGPAILATAVSTLAAVVFIKFRQAAGRNL